MEKNLAFLYFIIFAISYGLIFYLLLKSNFEKLFKPGKINEIRVGYFVTSFLLATIFSCGVVKIVESVYTLILK